jgi:hypothetical protein
MREVRQPGVAQPTTSTTTGEAEEEEMEDEEPENEEDIFEWSSRGGCERCDALDGCLNRTRGPASPPAG